MTFLTLFVFKGGIGFLSLYLMIVLTHILGKMHENVFNAMSGFGIKKGKGIMGGWQMTVHTIGNKSLCIIHMGGCFPGIISKLDFMTGCAKLGG